MTTRSSPTAATTVALEFVSQSRLRFDPSNPRFAGGGAPAKTQEQIQTLLEHEPHLALELKDSFLENGYIDYEPLVVRRGPDETFVVVEGNRRLAAIRHILAHRDDYASKSTRMDDLLTIPVLVFPEAADEGSQKEQRVYLGVKHLLGYREWPAESKARFLDQHINDKESLLRVMRETNIKKTDVQRYLIPYRLRKKAKDIWQPYGTQDFWYLGEALNRGGIKAYIELDVDKDKLDVRGFNAPKLKHLLLFVYGDPTDPSRSKRIRETRDLSKLAAALTSPRAAAALEKGRPLSQATLFVESPRESLETLQRLLVEMKVLLNQVLDTGSKQDRNPVLMSFAAFEKAAKAFVKHAKTSRI